MVLEGNDWDVQLLPTLAALPAALDLALIDMPIGLPDSTSRACDRAARARLGPRRSSVFPVPCRAAAHAPDYATANHLNRAGLGRGLARQSWNICARIAELDAFLLAPPSFPLREAHPELAFAALAGAPLNHPKRSPEGRAQRRALLTARYPATPELISWTQARYPHRLLAQDDLLDALVLALAARVPLVSLPAVPERDARGLPMEIVLPAWGPVS